VEHVSRALLRARARLVAADLDKRLAAEGNVTDDWLLAARARQLTSRHSRRMLASAIERLLTSRSRGVGFSAALPVDARAVRRAAGDLSELARTLGSRDAVTARGVALVRRLLIEPSSPLYRPEHPDDLDDATREALLALIPKRGRDSEM
jgi:hypothetical protein